MAIPTYALPITRPLKPEGAQALLLAARLGGHEGVRVWRETLQTGVACTAVPIFVADDEDFGRRNADALKQLLNVVNDCGYTHWTFIRATFP